MDCSINGSNGSINGLTLKKGGITMDCSINGSTNGSINSTNGLTDCSADCLMTEEDESVRQLFYGYQYDYKYETITDIDKAIERIKDCEKEEEMLEQIFKERVEELKSKLDSKLETVKNRKRWDLNNLRTFMTNTDKKSETKTQFKVKLLSGEIILKKPMPKMVKPELTAEQIREQFSAFKKEKIELNWAELKKTLQIVGNKVINDDGEDLSDFVKIEVTPEEIVIK